MSLTNIEVPKGCQLIYTHNGTNYADQDIVFKCLTIPSVGKPKITISTAVRGGDMMPFSFNDMEKKFQ